MTTTPTQEDTRTDAWGRTPGKLGCKHCEPDWQSVGRGWVEMIDNGPIGACPVCNPNAEHEGE